MIATDALKEIMKAKGVKNAVLCDRLGIKANVLSERLRQKNISVSKLREMAKLVDYKIVMVPRESKVPDGGYEIE